ncbi:hypothetical protein BJF79_45950 [Actinomadura sp. CNU-125]|uniref:TNT domain-containing protein n=1 Tax=Actinomadura sp. CNU-125 TaxID=1904961 RepID=UPI000960282E|nr:TNT domain-containing protein [Actinomadura sp. CNU-125]OLT23507.1 hypothetical protein BJF79_45950 [Actinomadura sp. CNU-125]
MTASDFNERLNDIASLLVHIMPECWEKAYFVYSAVGTSFEAVTIGGGLADPSRLNEHNRASVGSMRKAEELVPESGVYELLRDLRTHMYEEGRGAWWRMVLIVRCHADSPSPSAESLPQWEVKFEHPQHIDWWDEDFWRENITPAAAYEDLKIFPRNAESIPAWLEQLASVHVPAAHFDPQKVMHSPQREKDLAALLPAGLKELFPAARGCLLELLPPGLADRFQVGRLADGSWSVIAASPSWLAVRVDEGTCTEVHAFAEPRPAVAFAVGAVLAEAGTEVNSSILRAAGVLSKEESPRKLINAWSLGDYRSNGGKASRRTLAAPRPKGRAAARRRYVELWPLHNRPGVHFVCQPGPPPARGAFVSTHEIFQWHAENLLPQEAPPTADPHAEDAFPREMLAVGMELDAYGDRAGEFLFTIGTPFSSRGVQGTPDEHPYHVYRVQRPFPVSPGLFSPAPIFSTGNDERSETSGTGSRGFYLGRPISDLLDSGELIEITGPGGAPVPGTDHD